MPAWLLSPVVLKGVALLAAVLILLGLKHGYDERKRDEGRAEVQAKFDAYKTMAMKRTTDMALLWSASLDKLELESMKRQEAESAASKAFAQRAVALSHVPTVVISADAARLWGDITPVGPAAGAHKSDTASGGSGAKAISESALVGYVNDAKAAYDDAVGLFHDARDALKSCLDANALSQPKVNP